MTDLLARQRYDLVPAKSLKAHPENPNRGNLAVIADSVLRNGFYGSILVQASTKVIIAGEHRWRSVRTVWTDSVGPLFARLLSLWGHEPKLPELLVPVMLLDVDDATARRILLVDNRSGRIGYDDDEALADLLRSFDGDLAGTGYDDEDLDVLLRRLASLGDLPTDPYEEWVGMPDFEQQALRAAASVAIHFPTEKDATDFFTLIGRTKARSLWWPQDDGHVGSDIHKAYVAEDAPEPE